MRSLAKSSGPFFCHKFLHFLVHFLDGFNFYASRFFKSLHSAVNIPSECLSGTIREAEDCDWLIICHQNNG